MHKKEKAWLLKDWKVYPELNLIQNHQSELVIKPRLMKLLTFFLLHQNQIVAKEAILDFVWEDRIVTENLLTKSISELRKILDEHFAEQMVIETIRNVGYRLNTPNEIPLGPVASQPSVNEKTSGTKKRQSVLFILLLGLVLFAMAAWINNSKPTTQDYQVKVERVTSLQGQETLPVVSPDGKNIAFAYREKPGDRFHIYLKTIEGNAPRRLSESSADEFNPCWSPDGASIVFMRSDSNREVSLIKKSIIGADEIVLSKLTGYTPGRDLLWLEEENQLVFSAKTATDAPYCLYAYDFKQAKIMQLTQAPRQSFGDLHPVYIADNGTLAFIRIDNSVSEDLDNNKGSSVLNILDLKTNNLKLNSIAVFEEEVKELAYHQPSQQYLCWLSVALADNQLIGVDATGNKRMLYQPQRGLPSNGAVGPDHAFYYELWSSNLNVHQYELVNKQTLSSSSTEYLNSTLLDWGLRFATAADQMAFLSYRSGYKEIWIGAASQTDNAYQLTHFEHNNIQSVSISPDGRQLVFLVTEDGEAIVYTIQANGEGLKKISEPGVDYTLPEWLDDKSIYFGSNKSGQWDIWQKELETGKETLLVADGYTVLVAPSNSNYRYYTSLNLDTVFRLNPLTLSSSPVLTAPGVEAGNWAITDNGIYYLSWQSGSCQLVFYDFDTQLHHTLRKLENIIPGLTSLTISPSGDYLFLAQADEIGADLMRLKLE